MSSSFNYTHVNYIHAGLKHGIVITISRRIRLSSSKGGPYTNRGSY